MNSADQLIEQVLVLRCQIGDNHAFAELIDNYQRPLRYFITRLLGDPKTAEDIFQDTWLTVIKKICTLKEPNAFSTWLYRIARNHVYKELKRAKQLLPLDEYLTVSKNIENNNLPSDDVPKLHRALEKLRPEYKEVLMLRFLEQMSYQQISQVINCNLGTVKSRIYYAKNNLKKEMEK